MSNDVLIIIILLLLAFIGGMYTGMGRGPRYN